MIAQTLTPLLLAVLPVLGLPPCARDTTGCVVPPQPVPATNFFLPTTTLVYDVDRSYVYCSSPEGEVLDHKLTTVLTFTYPPASLGKTCQFAFSLAPTDTCTGTKQLDVWTSWSPVATCGGTGNHRDNQIGRIAVAAGQEATWVATYGTYMSVPTPCEAPGTVKGMEVSGVGDADHVVWWPAVSGPKIIYW
jgi:hypothetical protein